MPQVNDTAPPSNLEPSRAPTRSYPSVPALPAASGSTSSNSLSSKKTPTALRPHQFLSAAQKGPANRVQKRNNTVIKEEQGLKASYRLPGRLSQAPAPGALNPLPIHRTNPASRPLVSPLPRASKSIDKSRITIQNLTGPSSNVILDFTSPEPASQMASGLVNIKKEIKSEPEDEVTALDKIQPMRTGYHGLWEHGTPADRELLHCRWRLQHIAKEAEKHGLAARDALEVKDILDKLSTFPFEGNGFKEVKISTVVKLVAKPDIYGDVIAGRAQALRERWKSGDFSPDPFIDEDDDLVDSSDEEDYETSDEEDVAPPGPSNRGSTTPFQRERVNDCVARLMRGMIVGRGKSGTKIYRMDPRYDKKPADMFGHNGLTVGDWWPFQAFTLKDGAHGSKMGGIYGKKNVGAYSVVVSGGLYEDNDFDSGDRILYSGSKGGSNEDPTSEAPYTDVTKSLVISTKHAKPVRVLRSARNNSRWAPTAGIRYDGLYNVESYSIKTDSEGKKFYQFVLVRITNQPPIDRTRPTAVEIAALEKIREM